MDTFSFFRSHIFPQFFSAVRLVSIFFFLNKQQPHHTHGYRCTKEPRRRRDKNNVSGSFLQSHPQMTTRKYAHSAAAAERSIPRERTTHSPCPPSLWRILHNFGNLKIIEHVWNKEKWPQRDGINVIRSVNLKLVKVKG